MLKSWLGLRVRMLFVGIGVVGVALSLGACGGGDSTATSGSDGNFAVIEAGVHPFYAPFPAAIKAAEEEFGPFHVEVGAPQNFDQTEQNKVIDSFVAKGVNGVAVQPVDPVAGLQTVKRLLAQDVAIVGMVGCGELEGSGAEVCINADVVNSAREASKLLCEELGGSGNIVHLGGANADKLTALRQKAVEEALEEEPGCHLIQTINDIESAEASQEAVAALMASKGNEIDGVISTSYEPSVAIANEFEQRHEKRIKAILVDNDPKTIQAIKDGYVLATRANNAYEIAYLAALSLKYANEGCTWTGDSFNFESEYETITAKNVANFEQVLEAAAKETGKTWKSNWECP